MRPLAAASPDQLTALAMRARDGDRRAAADLVVTTQHEVWRLLAHLTHRAAADDLAQETFERALRSLHGYRGEAPARTWLISIARRVAADHRRHSSRHQILQDRLEAHAAAGPRGHPDHADSVAMHMDITGLTPARREAFALTQIAGLAYEEAATVIGCPIGTVRSRVARARADLAARHDTSAPRTRVA